MKIQISIFYDTDDPEHVKFSWDRVDPNPNQEGCHTKDFKKCLLMCLERIRKREVDVVNGIPFDTPKSDRAALQTINKLYGAKG